MNQMRKKVLTNRISGEIQTGLQGITSTAIKKAKSKLNHMGIILTQVLMSKIFPRIGK